MNIMFLPAIVSAFMGYLFPYILKLLETMATINISEIMQVDADLLTKIIFLSITGVLILGLYIIVLVMLIGPLIFVFVIMGKGLYSDKKKEEFYDDYVEIIKNLIDTQKH